MTGRFSLSRNLDAPTDMQCCWPACSMYVTERFRLHHMRMNVERRLKSYPPTTEILGVVAGGRDDERAAHRRATT